VLPQAAGDRSVDRKRIPAGSGRNLAEFSGRRLCQGRIMRKQTRSKRRKGLSKKRPTASPRRVKGKVSDALVDVARPLLDQQARDLETWEKIMKLAMLVWNAMVTEEETGEPVLTRLPAMLAQQTGLSEQGWPTWWLRSHCVSR